jgi:SAM-dependent methyltransferase
MPDAPPYRDFYYPLNVFMHVLTLEEGRVDHLHYGLFENDGESLAAAQEHSTELLLSRLPPPPARILDAGAGLGTTLARLTRLGCDVTGITPDEKQVAMIRSRYGDSVKIECTRFEDFAAHAPFDMIVFQESSQYIDSDELFAKAAKVTTRVLVLDEFALRDEGVLHRLDAFLAAAKRHGFDVTERLDLSAKAPRSIDYFTSRLPRYRDSLIRDLGLAGEQIDELIANAQSYAQMYRKGVYGYLLVSFRAA